MASTCALYFIVPSLLEQAFTNSTVLATNQTLAFTNSTVLATNQTSNTSTGVYDASLTYPTWQSIEVSIEGLVTITFSEPIFVPSETMNITVNQTVNATINSTANATDNTTTTTPLLFNGTVLEVQIISNGTYNESLTFSWIATDF
jgi:hypothetical protein